jgi:hypothetical protein
MKTLSLPFIFVGALCLSSCGLLKSATQLPLRTLQSLGRSTGMGLEQSETKGKEPEVKFEIKKER